MPLISHQTGKQLIEILRGPDGEVLYDATLAVSSDNKLTALNENWHDKKIEASNRLLLQGNELTLGAQSSTLEASKLAWEIIKEGKSVGKSADAKSSVLSKADLDPLNYEGAVSGKSGTYTWEVNDACTIFGKINYVTIKVRLEGKFKATPTANSKAPAGHYLPDVYVNVTHCTTKFPCSASGSANLSNPSNIGRGEVNTEVKAHAKLTAGWFAQHFGITIGFQATGTGGFKLLGKE